MKKKAAREVSDREHWQAAIKIKNPIASRKLAAGPAMRDAKFGSRRVGFAAHSRQTAERMKHDFDDLDIFHFRGKCVGEFVKQNRNEK